MNLGGLFGGLRVVRSDNNRDANAGVVAEHRQQALTKYRNVFLSV